MKKLFYIILFLFFMVSSAWAYTETFYVCNGGDGTLPETDACATAWDFSDLQDSGNWAATDTNDGKIGPNDIVYFKDDGGDFRNNFAILESGLSGKPITFKNYSGDTPVIRNTDQLTGWSEIDATYHIWRAAMPAGTDFAYGMLNEAQTARNPYENGYGKPSYSAFSTGYFWGGSTTDNYAYIQSSTDPDSWTLTPEVGVRNYGILIYYKDYITIDGLTIYGPEGEPTGTQSDSDTTIGENESNRHGSKYKGGIYVRGNTTITIQNVIVSHTAGIGIHVRGSGQGSGVTIDACWVSDGWGGIWSSNANGSDYGPITISNSMVTDNSITDGDQGDRDAMGFYNTQNTIIEDSYIDTTGYSSDVASDITDGACILFAQSEGMIVRRNYLKNCAYQGLSVGGNLGQGSYGVQVYDNIIDDWGYVSGHAYDPGDGNYTWYCGVRIGSGSTSSDDYGDVLVYNNLFVNGPSEDSAGNFAALRINNYNYQNVEIKNNLFHNNNTEYELYYDVNTYTGHAVSNNYFYKTSGKALYWFGTDYVYNQLATWQAAKSYVSSNYNQDDGTLADAAGDDPQLNSDFTHSSGTPSIITGGGVDLADADYDEGLSPDRIWTPFSSMLLSTFTRDTTYPIGPYDSGLIISDGVPNSLQDCDGASSTDAVSWSSSAASTCRYSDESGGDSCSTAYADLDTLLGSATYTFNSTVNCGSSKIYVIKCQDNSTSAISNCLEITHEVAAGGGASPQPAPVTIIGGGTLSIVGGGNLVIH